MTFTLGMALGFFLGIIATIGGMVILAWTLK